MSLPSELKAGERIYLFFFSKPFFLGEVRDAASLVARFRTCPVHTSFRTGGSTEIAGSVTVVISHMVITNFERCHHVQPVVAGAVVPVEEDARVETHLCTMARYVTAI